MFHSVSTVTLSKLVSIGFFFSQYVNLRTRYSELMTLNNQYIKFIIETQLRLDDEEVCTHLM